ncbi:MAG: hypothetical protein IPK10_06705 [Bacteroidetes bacterium]|nr:hypothetical protein [Bacteroidota bacterium]
MKLKYLFLSIGFLIPFMCLAQEDSVPLRDELNFIFHLGDNKQIDDLESYSNQILNDTTFYSQDFRDSVAFASGTLFKDFKLQLKARYYFDLVSMRSVFKIPAAYTSGLMEMDEHHYDKAYQKIFDAPEAESGILYELRIFELAGLSLLKKDYGQYDLLATGFFPEDSTIHVELKYLSDYNYILQNMKKKSGFVAGALSAIIPGLGKLYTGLPGQALASFLKVVPLGIITAENFRNGEFKNAQFYIFGSLFSLFYIGGIWGSSISAKIVYQEKVDEIHHNIRVGLHVPVDRIFH